jgi:hypothetical protein
MSYTVSEDKSNTSSTSRVDADLESRARRTAEKICENLHIIANEPSLALYRISEHVRKALPPTVESRCEVKRLNEVLVGAHYDAEYGLQCVQAMSAAAPEFEEIEQLLRRSLLLQQQFKHAPQKRVKREGSSLIQRISVHLPSVDIPDLPDFRDTNRGAVHRSESGIIKDRNPSKSGSVGGGGAGGPPETAVDAASQPDIPLDTANRTPEPATRKPSTGSIRIPESGSRRPDRGT